MDNPFFWRKKKYLVATFVTYKYNKRPVVLLHVVVYKGRDTRIQLFAHQGLSEVQAN